MTGGSHLLRLPDHLEVRQAAVRKQDLVALERLKEEKVSPFTEGLRESSRPFRPDNVFARKALPHGNAGLARDAVVGQDRLQTLALLRDVEDVAALRPCGRDLGGQLRFVREEKRGVHPLKIGDSTVERL